VRRLERAALPAALALAAAVGLCGLGWGLPSRARLAAFPEALYPTREVADRFARAWEELYRGVERVHEEVKGEEPVTYVKGVEVVPAGWDWPPPKLLNSYRSLLLRSEHPDEQKSFVVLARMRPWRLEFEPLWVQYGGAFIYPLGAFLQGLAWLGAVRLVPDMTHYLTYPEDMGTLYAAGRLFVLAFHLGAVWALFDLARRLSGPRAAFFASALFSLCPLVVNNAHVLKPHPYAAFWLVAAARWAALASESGKAGHYRWAGVAAGLAAGSNFSLLPFAAAGPLAWLLRGKDARRAERRGAAESAALAAAAFLVTNPYAVLMRGKYAWETGVYTAGHAAPTLASAASLFGPSLAVQLGLVAQLLAAAGIAWALRPRASRPARLVGLVALGGTAVLWLGLAAFWGWLQGPESLRFFYPLVPLYCLLAACAACDARLPRALGTALLALALLDTGVRAAPYLVALRRDGGPLATRARAASWIEANVPPGSSIGLARYPQPATTPVFRYDLYRLVLFDDPRALPASERPDVIVVDEPARAPVESALGDEYELAVAAEPAAFGWGRVRDKGFFADAPMYVFKRKAPPPAPARPERRRRRR
jgi:hypothetical protein